jgi:hypothetical protein
MIAATSKDLSPAQTPFSPIVKQYFFLLWGQPYLRCSCSRVPQVDPSNKWNTITGTKERYHFYLSFVARLSTVVRLASVKFTAFILPTSYVSKFLPESR